MNELQADIVSSREKSRAIASQDLSKSDDLQKQLAQARISQRVAEQAADELREKLKVFESDQESFNHMKGLLESVDLASSPEVYQVTSLKALAIALALHL